MNLLSKILQTEAKESEYGKLANKLRDQYAKENSKYKNGQVVKFKKSYINDKLFTGRIIKFKFKTSPYGIIYTLKVVNKDGIESKSDPGFYYIMEQNIMNTEFWQ